MENREILEFCPQTPEITASKFCVDPNTWPLEHINQEAKLRFLFNKYSNTVVLYFYVSTFSTFFHSDFKSRFPLIQFSPYETTETQVKEMAKA